MAAIGETHWWYRSTRALLQQLIDRHADPAVSAVALDAAGGTGATGGWLSDRGPTVLADFESIALELARDGHPGYLTTRADINRLPFATDSFGLVLCVTALYHRMNADPSVAVREFARVAEPGALVVLMEPAGRRLRRSHDEVTHTGRRFSLGDVKALASGAGLDVVTATCAYSFLLPPAFAMALFDRGGASSDLDHNQSGLGGLLSAAASVERRIIRHVSVPFGLSAVVVARKRR